MDSVRKAKVGNHVAEIFPAHPALDVGFKLDPDGLVIQAGEFEGLFPTEEGGEGKGGIQQVRMISPDRGDVERFAVLMKTEDFLGEGGLGHGGVEHCSSGRTGRNS